VKDLKVFASLNEDLFKEMTMLLTLDNFRYMFYIEIVRFLFKFAIVIYVDGIMNVIWVMQGK
jgi:hypothetical protein